MKEHKLDVDRIVQDAIKKGASIVVIGTGSSGLSDELRARLIDELKEKGVKVVDSEPTNHIQLQQEKLPFEDIDLRKAFKNTFVAYEHKSDRPWKRGSKKYKGGNKYF